MRTTSAAGSRGALSGLRTCMRKSRKRWRSRRGTVAGNGPLSDHKIRPLWAHTDARDRAAGEGQEVAFDPVGENHTSFGHQRLDHEFAGVVDPAGDEVGLRALADERFADGPDQAAVF